jgi:hypothetical protein
MICVEELLAAGNKAAAKAVCGKLLSSELSKPILKAATSGKQASSDGCLGLDTVLIEDGWRAKIMFMGTFSAVGKSGGDSLVLKKVRVGELLGG